MFISNRYKVNFVVQCKYANWQVQNENESWFAETNMLKPFINTFNYFIGVVISYIFGSFL